MTWKFVQEALINGQRRNKIDKMVGIGGEETNLYIRHRLKLLHISKYLQWLSYTTAKVQGHIQLTWEQF